ncbi:MAG: hypothetical protein GX891_02015 [Clostridiales bacterium]|mgnify:CR=1 FL=1|nr:hypothetical protein [Clostridiales bacterium]
MDNVEMIINELEAEVLKARKAAFSQTEVVLDRYMLLDIINRLRVSLPSEFREARAIVKEREEILSQANMEAQRIVSEAAQAADQMTSESEIIREAHERADQIILEAEESFRKADYEARSAAFSILDRTEKLLQESIKAINERKRRLIED